MDAVTKTLQILEQRRVEEDTKVTRHLDRCYPAGRAVKVRKGGRLVSATVAERPEGLSFPQLALANSKGKVSHHHFEDVHIDRGAQLTEKSGA